MSDGPVSDQYGNNYFFNVRVGKKQTNKQRSHSFWSDKAAGHHLVLTVQTGSSALSTHSLCEASGATETRALIPSDKKQSADCET